MLYLIIILILLTCITYVIYPFIYQSKHIDPLLYKRNIKIRKRGLISELNNELESGILSNDLYNQLKDDVDEMINSELKNLNKEIKIIDPIEKLIQSKKNEKNN